MSDFELGILAVYGAVAGTLSLILSIVALCKEDN